jgi:Ca2+-transporting ATPase
LEGTTNTNTPEQKPVYTQSTEETLLSLHSDKEGLSAHEVSERLKQYGPNVLKPKGKHWLKRLLEPFASLFVSVLVVAIIISLLTHERIDAIVIGIILAINAGIYYAQQYSADKVLKTLKKQDETECHVKRGGQMLLLPASQLVPGDIVYLAEGVKVPADGRVLESDNLRIDEAILTGESLPITKITEQLSGKLEVYDQKNMVFKDTLVHGGEGVILVTATGNQTEIGKISELVQAADLERSPIERKIDDITKKLVVGVACLVMVVFVLALIRGITTAEALRFSLAMVVSAVPEGLPVALTVVLLLGAKKLAKVKALVKKISSIETLGAITLIATDKTGTLTKNKLSVAELAHYDGHGKAFAQAVLASLNGDDDLHADPLDAILDNRFNEHIPKDWKKLKEYPFVQTLRVSGVLWSTPHGQHLFTKGAPEAVLGHSHSKQAHNFKKHLAEFTSKGYRTIAVAHKQLDHTPKELDNSVLANLTVDGLLGLADELRDHIADSISEARRAGVRVVMLTGDHVDTARRVAMNIGLATSEQQVAESYWLEEPYVRSLPEKLKTIVAFGRVLPVQKFNFLKAVKGQEITAMTGDGVNDIPALVEADAGLAMGSGTDAAKDASDIVLMDDNFRTIIAAIRVGRSVVANIKKMLFYLLSTSLGEALTMVGALLIGLPLPVTAIQILWINLVTDGFSVLPLGLSPPEKHQMERPPHNSKAPLLNLPYIARMLMIAVVMATTTLILFNRALANGHAYAQTVAFMSLVAAQWANALNANFEFHSWVRNLARPNKWLILGIALAVGVQWLAMAGPLSDWFGTARLVGFDLMLVIGLPIVAVLITGDISKLLFKQKRQDAAQQVLSVL